LILNKASKYKMPQILATTISNNKEQQQQQQQ
jgi:hypothetical protein